MSFEGVLSSSDPLIKKHLKYCEALAQLAVPYQVQRREDGDINYSTQTYIEMKNARAVYVSVMFFHWIIGTYIEID